MRDTDGRLVRPVGRVKGRDSLVLRLRRLALAAARYARHRAATPHERAWAGALLDDLLGVLDAATRDEAGRLPVGVLPGRSGSSTCGRPGVRPACLLDADGPALRTLGSRADRRMGLVPTCGPWRGG